MMEIWQLCKSFEGRAVLENVDLTVPDGAVLCLMAPSGRGKTTLLRCIAGLETPDGGTVTGVPERIGFVFQEDRLCLGLDAVENVRLVTGRRMTVTDIEAQLTELGLDTCLHQRTEELSGGQRTDPVKSRKRRKKRRLMEPSLFSLPKKPAAFFGRLK